MQKHFITLLIVFQLVTIPKIFSQNIALNATGSLPDTSAMLDVSSTNKGFLLPRMTAAQVSGIPLPATGLIIFNTSINAFQVNAGTPASPNWQTLGTTVGNWLSGGNGGTNSGSKFVGTTDSVSLRFRTNNTQRLVLDSLGNVGIGAAPSFTSGTSADKLLVDAGITKSYNVITAKGTVNNYLQFNVQNQSAGTSASSDLVATADNGSETSNFVNMGINGSGNTDATMGGADDAYLFNLGNNLLLGACSSSKSIVFVTGSTSQATNERMRIDGTGKVGIGTTTPGSALDVKGTLHLSGSTSGYIGFMPPPVAGATTYTLPGADGASGQVLSTNGSGTLSWATASAGSTTHTINSSGNILTSTVNGVADTAKAVNTIANTSTANILTTTVNGVAANGVNIINTNALSLSGSNLTSTVNGVASTALALSSLDSSIYKMDGTLWGTRTVTIGANNLTFNSSTGNLIFNPSSTGKLGIGTTAPGSSLDVKGILHLSGSTSGYVGFAPAAIAGSTTYTLPNGDGSNGQSLTTNGSGTLSWATPSVTVTHSLNSNGNILTSTVNGVTDTTKAINTVANTSTANTLTTTVNGVAANSVNIINTNALSLSGSNLTSTINGIASSAVALSSLDSSIYKMDGALWGTRTVTMGANNLTFGSSTGNLIFNPSSTGKVGIGTTSPGSSLDVKGTLHLSGSTSGYVGFVPAAVAGSTTYTLPAADGISGQQLTTNGSGALSWAAAGSNSATTNTLVSSTNIITSTVNGITDTAKIVNSIANTSSANTLTTTVNGVAATGVTIINSNALSLSGQNLTSTTNGVASTAVSLAAVDSSIYKTDGALRAARTVTMGSNNLTFNSSSGNLIFNPSSTGKVGIGTTSPNYPLHIHDATVNPATGTWMQISNNASGSGPYDGFYYGVSSTGAPQIWAENYLDIITGSGTTNNTAMRLQANGNVGIGTTSPASALDVKGTLHLSGSSSGYVGFAPAATAGSTTYTLPAADGNSGQQLTTNGSGVLSWTSAGGSGSGWSLTGNSGTSSGTNYIGTSDDNDLIFKRKAIAAGSLTTNSTSFGVSSSVNSTQASAFGASAVASGNASIAVGYNSSATMPNSVSIGSTSYVQPGSSSTDDIAIGYGANVSGGTGVSYSTAIGSAAQVQATNGLAIGKSAVVSSQYGISIGDASQAQGASAVVLGQNAYANGVSSIAIGGAAAANKTQAQGAYSISLGYYAYTSNQDGIAIGDHAQAQGTNTTVIGSGIYNGTNNTVAIGNSSVTSFLMNGASAGTNKALVVGSSSSNGNGAYLTTGGTWTNASDRNLKDDFSKIDGEEILNKVSQLDITRWKYKGTSEYHIGPMAQDFYQSFKLGNDDRHISTIDPSGIALISIKALKQENDNLNKKLEAQQKLIEELQKTVDEIKARLP